VDLLVFEVIFQNFLSTILVRWCDSDNLVKTTWSLECAVQHVRLVGRTNDNNSARWFETVHLCEKFIKGLSCVVLHSSTTALAQSIDFIKENDAWRALLSLLEQLSNPSCTQSYEHLLKLGGRCIEEGYACFSRNGLGQ